MRQRDKSDLPLPSLSYKYFLLWYSSPILSFYSLTPIFLAMALLKNFMNSGKDFLQQPSKSLIRSSPREEMAINFVVPEVNLPPPFFLHFCCTPVHLEIYLLSTLFSFIISFLFLHPPNPLGVGR